MSDKELISRGAECVFGDLYLKRVLVGVYRNGQFILTPEGAEELQNVIEAEVTVVTPKATAKKGKAAALETTLADDLAGLDTILNP